MAVRGLAADAPLTVTRDGTDVTAVFATRGNGERRGLVTGLHEGENTLVAISGAQRATLVVRDHPATGPITSGPHQEPFACRTEDAGLGPPLDEDCSIAPVYQWFYRSTTDQGFHELADPSAPYPPDVMTTESSSGEAVPFVARVETRTINRGITRIAVLDDPAGRADPMAFTGGSFDGRVYHAFGESCGVGYQQGVNDPLMVLGAVDLTQVSADRLLINLTGIDQIGPPGPRHRALDAHQLRRPLQPLRQHPDGDDQGAHQRAVRPGRGGDRHQRLGRRPPAVQRHQQRPRPAPRRRGSRDSKGKQSFLIYSSFSVISVSSALNPQLD